MVCAMLRLSRDMFLVMILPLEKNIVSVWGNLVILVSFRVVVTYVMVLLKLFNFFKGRVTELYVVHVVVWVYLLVGVTWESVVLSMVFGVDENVCLILLWT